jgi:hypothetical protein
VEANSTGGQGSRRAVAPSNDDDDDDDDTCVYAHLLYFDLLFKYTTRIFLEKVTHAPLSNNS